MIDRCNAMDRKLNDLLARRQAIATSFDVLTVHKIEDMETILFAVRYAASCLGEQKSGQGQQASPLPSKEPL